MKLATIRLADGTAKPVAVTDDGRYLDLSAADPSLPDSLITILAAEGGLVRAATAKENAERAGNSLQGTLIAPIPRPGKVICIGLNYRDHAAETGAAIPTEPVIFSKFSSSVIGPGEAIRLPAVSNRVDYEAELVVVIGKAAKHVAVENAMSYVAGYMNGHDVSARDWQKGRPGGQWLIGKTPDTFAPTGPYLVTADEIADPQNLDVTFRLNGEVLQSGSTRSFIFGVDFLIAHMSKLFTLEPGDLIFTGTPPGVGDARKPPIYLKPGDMAEVEIAGLGVLRNPVVADEH